ncbi:LicD family protein [Sinomicrobium oceani]|uniref:LicD family protein n=1 Tax=Sinomicrobium oceani TaxID=1150368 RepID=UPI00227CFC4B|nr:LicD family protein [Sinomicrobium oceani]
MKKINKIKTVANYNVLFPDIRGEVKGEIAQAHIVLLRMIKIFNFICQKHDIKYWLDYGTLLGAVRHNGFIPWDGDIDIGILRKDFEKFKQIVTEELPEDIFFQTVETDPYYNPFFIEAKLRDKYSSYTSFAAKNPLCKWHNGLQIDFFIYDVDTSNSKKLLNIFERKINQGNIYLYKEDIEELICCPFEDIILPIPLRYDRYLKQAYGNYMVLPPEEERVPGEGKMNVFKPCDHAMALDWHKKQ